MRIVRNRKGNGQLILNKVVSYKGTPLFSISKQIMDGMYKDDNLKVFIMKHRERKPEPSNQVRVSETLIRRRLRMSKVKVIGMISSETLKRRMIHSREQRYSQPLKVQFGHILKKVMEAKNNG